MPTRGAATHPSPGCATHAEALTGTTIHKAAFTASGQAVNVLCRELVGLQSEASGDVFWLWGPSLNLGPTGNHWRERLEEFARRANVLIAVSDATLQAIHPTGALLVGDGQTMVPHMIAEPAVYQLTGGPVTFNARGVSGPLRSIAERALELCSREPRFERAANILADCGDDLVKLYMVMELIEKAHGCFASKKHPDERRAFCERIEVREEDWVALHRTARPFRHAEPHEDDGPVVSPRHARALIQHALKLWVVREVPH